MDVQQDTKKFISRRIQKPSRKLLEIYDDTDILIKSQRKSGPVAPKRWPNREISFLHPQEVLNIFWFWAFSQHILGFQLFRNVFIGLLQDVIPRPGKSDQLSLAITGSTRIPMTLDHFNWIFSKAHNEQLCTYMEFKSKRILVTRFFVIQDRFI